jgi:hypothetical protein
VDIKIHPQIAQMNADKDVAADWELQGIQEPNTVGLVLDKLQRLPMAPAGAGA